MNVESYCSAMQTELTGWKAKVYDVVRAFEKLESGRKDKILNQVQDLHIIVSDLERKIDRLKNECPDAWSDEKSSIDQDVNSLNFKWQEVWGSVAGGDFGG